MYSGTLQSNLDDSNQLIIDKALEREINFARKIQSQLLNGKTPRLIGAEVFGSSLPARLIGGDYYDFFSLENGNTRIVIGDVMGKGIPAAMLMILTRGAFRTAAAKTSGPAETLVAMNKAIYEDLRTLKSFVTLFCAEWNPKENTFTYANAGHNLPLFINARANHINEIPKASGIMLGGLPNQNYKEVSVQLDELDTIFFFTDGIIEARNKDGDQYKLERLIHTLFENKVSSVEEIEKYVIDSVKQFTEGVAQRDDITMVLFRVNKKTE